MLAKQALNKMLTIYHLSIFLTEETPRIFCLRLGIQYSKQCKI